MTIVLTEAPLHTRCDRIRQRQPVRHDPTLAAEQRDRIQLFLKR